MRMYDIIEKKKRGGALSGDEIRFFVSGVTDGTIPDYQISAFLMAVWFNSMTDAETAALTLAMADSGGKADLSGIDGATVDKHSTGGVGDKTTLIAAPIAAALGDKVAKMSGRGLGHTGGTLDKLESIPGLSTSMPREEFIRQVNETGIAVIGQAGGMAPADKRLYALRDVTATVDSVPLIASSIMSKKLAAGSKNIVLDVKYGSGAFMKTEKDARLLAEKMMDIGKRAGRNTAAVISSMESPLGNAVGNAAEVAEAAEVLRGGGPSDLRSVSILLAALMHSLASGRALDECMMLCADAVKSGRAYEKLREMAARQGGDVRFIDDPGLFPAAKNIVEFGAPGEGYISREDAEKIGLAACVLGAGREKKDDTIDYSAGIILKKKPGGYVRKGDVIAVLMSNGETSAAMRLMESAVVISDAPVGAAPLILDILT